MRLILSAYALPLTFTCTLLMYQIGCMPYFRRKEATEEWTKINILPLLFSVKGLQKQQQQKAEQHHIFPGQGNRMKQHQSHLKKKKKDSVSVLELSILLPPQP